MTRKQRRIRFIILGLLGLAAAAALVLTALEEKVTFFYTPSEIPEQLSQTGRSFRLGGLVAEGTVQTAPNNAARIYFEVEDDIGRITVTYTGILPDLFREGQGVVAEGFVREDGIFEANTILAKHDENYMPPEVARAMGKRHEEGVEDMLEDEYRDDILPIQDMGEDMEENTGEAPAE